MNEINRILAHVLVAPLICLLASTQLFSQQVSTADTTSTRLLTEEQKEEKPTLTYSGYLDTYYFTNLNAPSSRNNLGSSGIARGFDRYVDQFQIGMFLNRISYSYKNTEVVGEIGFGPNVEYGSYGNDFRYKWGSVLANSTTTAIMIKQAYINYKANDKLTFTMGQFGTHIGYEYIDAPLNFHYSINNTFNAGVPFYHLGLKANYAFSSKVSLMAGVVNGTDNSNDNNRGKSIIGQLIVNPAKGLTIYLNTLQGNEANARVNGKDTTSYFGLVDLIVSYQATERFMVAAWVMTGSAKGEFQGGTYFADKKTWSGANLYLTYKFTDLFTLGTRLEYFDNMSGARALLTNGQGTDVKTFTLTGSFSLVDGKLTLKPEFRFDNFKKMEVIPNQIEVQQFQDKDGEFTKNTQSTLGMAAIYKF